ncbi:DJ-1/PfpI family protein [Mycoplasmatota bacterium WC44]
MKIALYLYDGYFETEICIPALLFSKEELFTLSSDQDVVKCKDGRRVLVDYTVSEVNPSEIDVLIIPGGTPIIKEDVLKLITDCEKHGTIIGSICGGVDYLAHAGVLSNRKYTSYYEKEKTYEFLPTDGTLSYSMYETDKNVVTAKPAAYLEFALELYHLAGFEIKSIDNYIEWFKSPFCWNKDSKK